MRRFAAAMLVFGACTAESATPGDKLIGVWLTDLDPNGCVLGFAFEDGTVEQDVICPLTTGELGVEASFGDYTEDGSVITARLTHSSCANAEPTTAELAFRFPTGDSLQLVTPARVIVLKRVDTSAEPSSLSAVFG